MDNLYEINKQLIKTEQPLPLIKVKKELRKIRDNFFMIKEDKYFMLLNRETYNFTLFNLGDKDIGTMARVMEGLKDCLNNRGRIVSAELTEDSSAYEIWLRDDNGDDLLYYLFPYDEGVIE